MYRFQVHEYADHCVLHCTVEEWSHSVFKDMRLTMAAIREAYNDKPLFAPYMDAKQGKFMAMLGFKDCGDLGHTADGSAVSMWRLV